MSVPFLCCHHHQTLAIPLSAASSASSPYLPPFFPRLDTFLPCLPSIPLPVRPSLTPSLHPLARHPRFCASHRPQYDWRSRHPWAPARHPLQEPHGAAAKSVNMPARSAPVGPHSAPAAKTARRCSQKCFRNTPARSAPAGTRVGTCVFGNKS